MDKALELFSSETSVPLRAVPRLKLLLELQPAHEVFFSNLVDTISLRSVPPIEITSPPADFWHDVFVPTALPWRSFQESMLWHLVAFIAAWGLSQGWASRPQPHVGQQSFRTSGSVYYKPSKIYPAARSSPPRTEAHSKGRAQATSHSPAAMPVAAEHKRSPSLVVPPDLKMAEGPRAPNLAATPPMPAVRLSATGRTTQTPLGGLGSVVAPPPELGGRANRLSGLAQTSVVAPPADVGGIAGRRSLRGPGASVIEPPPMVQDLARRGGSLGGGNAQVVAPPPQLPSQGLGAGSRSLSAAGGAVVPPPPSVEHSGRAGSVSGPGLAVVPPPPALQGAGGVGGSGRAGSLTGVGSQVVPPPPSVQSGGGLLAGLVSLFSGSATKVVPPPPALQGAGDYGSGGGREVGPLAGGGSSQVVPPPPAMQGGGTGHGRITSLSSGGSEIVPPPPSLQGAGGTSVRGGLGNSLSRGGSRVVPPPPSMSGAGAGSGTGIGSGGHSGSLSAGSVQVVPPPPSVQGAARAGAGSGGRVGSLGGGTEVVPPPPGLQGAGNGGGGRIASLSEGGGNVVGPPPSVGNGGGSGGSTRTVGPPGGDLRADPPPAPGGGGGGSMSTGPLEQMDPLPDTAPAQQSAANNGAPAEDVPLRLVGVAVASSKTSFFSGYEVFVAERRLNQSQTELIKLVFVFLPYQKRLSEYDLNTTKVYKLRATRDPRCDETLMQMTWPEGEVPDPDAQAAANSLASTASNKNSKLPCYNTTADDFQRAISHAP
jgi:hypothetical protein